MDELIKHGSVTTTKYAPETSGTALPESILAKGATKASRLIRAVRVPSWLSRVGLVIPLAIISALTILIMMFHISYSVSVNDTVLGNISHRNDLEAIVDSAEAKVSDVLGYDYELANVSLKMVVAPRSEYIDTRAIEKSLVDSVDSIVKSYYLEVDGEPVYRADSYDKVSSLLTRIKAPYLSNSGCISVDFSQDVSIQYGYVPTATSTRFNTVFHELENSLTAMSSYQIQYTQDLAYETVYYDDDTIYEGNSVVTTAGVYGQEQITAVETYLNNDLLETEIVNSEIISEPVTEYIAVGTKVRPSPVSYGNYIWPVSGGGNLTSYFGPRNSSIGSRNHQGIDICAAYGTDIFAADGGTVIYAGWMSGYGNLVQVLHDNGEVTYYAHCSALYVSVGDPVFQGEVIAAVGSTGTSSANHCHFEIRVGGVAVDPLNYV